MPGIRPLTVTALVAVVFAFAGCAPSGSGGARGSGGGSKAKKLLDAGGSGLNVTPAFDATGHTVRVDYHFSEMPDEHQATFILERAAGEGAFERSSSVTETLSDKLDGSKNIPLIPGRYRLRVQASASWTAEIYETAS